jgi:hypothetical protein
MLVAWLAGRRACPAYAYVTIPISQGFEYAWFRKSRLQLGRQILAQGFDYAILDGSQARLYWSPEGQILIYGGQTKNIDLFETNSSPLIGGSVQQGFFGYQLSAGYSVRESKLDTSLIDGGVMKFWEDLPWSPQALVKAQWSQNQNQPVQSLEELLISPLDFMSITLSHSYRTPRPMDNEWRTFVFRIFSQTPMESQQGSVNFSLFSPLEIQGLIRQLRFKGGSDSELGLQQEWSASTKISEALLLSCYVGYVRGFGGFAHDYGISTKVDFSERTQFQSELSAVQYDKINGMNAWAYNFRNGLNFSIGPKLTALAWVELERNHRFEFDGSEKCMESFPSCLTDLGRYYTSSIIGGLEIWRKIRPWRY